MTAPRSTPAPLPARTFLLLTAGIALVTGLLEAALYQVLRAVRGFAWSGPDAFWAAPLSYLVLAAVVAVPLALVAARFPRLATPRWLLTPFLAAAAFLLLLVAFTSQLHWVARLALALGLGLRAAGPLARWAGGAPRRVDRLAWASLGAVGLAAVLAIGGPVWRERRGLATHAPRRDGPNVLFLILDTVRARSLSLYGYARPTTPNLARWAERGVVFDSAMTPSAWTLPSHGSLFSGRRYADFRADFMVPFGDSLPVLAEVFTQAGYRTGGFVANWFYTTRESGLARGFLHYEDLTRRPKQILLYSALGQVLFGGAPGGYRTEHDVDRKDASRINSEFLRWVARPSDRPFFAFLNYFDAHRPYKLPNTGYPEFAGKKRTNRDKYDLSLWYLDRELGALFTELEHRGILEHTIVVITADHGEQFGERGFEGHGNSLYLPVLHVPLLMFGPGIPAGVRVSRPVGVRNVGRTMLALAEVADSQIQGRTLAGCWQLPRCGWPDSLPVGAALAHLEGAPPTDSLRGRPSVSVLLGGWEYVRLPNGREELYRPGGDSLAANNLADDPALADTLRRLREAARAYELPGTLPPRTGGR